MIALLVTAALASRPFQSESYVGKRVQPSYKYKSAVPPSHSRRQLSEDGYGPIRIKPFYSRILSSITTEQEAFLKETLVPTASSFWGQLLHVPQVANMTIPEGATHCFETEIPAAHLASGVAEAEFLLYITADNTSHCDSGGGGDTLAYAGVCFLDSSNDRPIAGFANFCPQHVSLLATEEEYQITIAIHEMAHALGFAAESLKYYRHPNGTARVPRGSDGEPLLTTHSCTSDVYPFLSASFLYPKEVLKVATERGHLVGKVVTESVVTAGRDFFDCASLDGVELENQDPSRTCGLSIGSHWEERILGSDFMSAIAGEEMLLSPLTLALFADMGWYQVQPITEVAAASDMVKARVRTPSWGRAMGCPFLTDSCITSAGESAFPPFCDTAEQQACSPDRRARGVCSLSDYTANLPSEYQYFSDPKKGGAQELVDYCPVTQSFTNGDCRNTANAPTGRNYQGVSYTDSSRCVESSIYQVVDGYQLSASPTTACYEMSCRWMYSESTPSWRLYIKVIRRSSVVSTNPADIWIECNTAGESKAISGFKGSLTCPSPAELCAPDAAVGQTMVVVNATPTTATASDGDVESSFSQLGAATFYDFKAGRYQQGWAVKMLSSVRNEQKISAGVDYRDHIFRVWAGAFMAPMSLLILLLLFLTIRVFSKPVRNMEVRSPVLGYVVIVLLVMSVVWTFGATGGVSSLKGGIEHVAEVVETFDTFFNESLAEAGKLLEHGKRFNESARNAGCVDTQLTDEMAMQGQVAVASAGTQLTHIQSFVDQVKAANFEAGPDAIGFDQKDELTHKYKWRVGAYVYTIQAFVLIACAIGIIAMITRNFWLLHITTFVGVLMLLLTAFSFSVAVATSVVLTDFCAEIPENATVRLLHEGGLLNADNLDIASYYLKCSGRNPLSGSFVEATNAMLLIENATTILMTLKLPSLDLSSFANGTNESAYLTSLATDGHKLFTLSDADEIASGIDLDDIPVEYR
jgi:hypothetical protein